MLFLHILLRISFGFRRNLETWGEKCWKVHFRKNCLLLAFMIMLDRPTGLRKTLKASFLYTVHDRESYTVVFVLLNNTGSLQNDVLIAGNWDSSHKIISLRCIWLSYSS